MEWFQLAPGRKVVMQIFCYADRGQPAGVNGKPYSVCDKHQRPSDKPYLGLTRNQTEHANRHQSLYVPA